MTDRGEESGYFVSWSGGKDSCLALHRFREGRHAQGALLTMLDETGTRSRGHHLRPEVLAAQAEALGMRLETRTTSWERYEDVFKQALAHLRSEGFLDGVFGDIDLDPHREWVERVCAETGVTGHEPLWLEERRPLIQEFLDAGYVAVVVGVREDALGAEMLGRILSTELIAEFETAGIDACGELGEYHSVVIDGPGFRRRLELEPGGLVRQAGYCFLDLVPAGRTPV